MRPISNENHNKLWKFCKENGMEFLRSANGTHNNFIINEIDPWAGVEFVYNKVKREYRKIESRSSAGFRLVGGEGVLLYANALAVTEKKYMEQLMDTAHGLFGDIKDGDRFDLSGIDPIMGNDVSIGNVRSGFKYDNTSDLLYFGDIPIFKQGKWAKKLEQPIYKPSPIDKVTTSNLHRILTILGIGVSMDSLDRIIDVVELMVEKEDGILNTEDLLELRQAWDKHEQS